MDGSLLTFLLLLLRAKVASTSIPLTYSPDLAAILNVTDASWLQHCLNIFRRDWRVEPDYPLLEVNGLVDQTTLDALSTFFAVRGKERATRILLNALYCMQGSHYLSVGIKCAEEEDWFYDPTP